MCVLVLRMMLQFVTTLQLLIFDELVLPKKNLEGCREEGLEEVRAWMIGWLAWKGRPELRQTTKKLSFLFRGLFSVASVGTAEHL